jgi:hypothetical protein
VQVALVRRSSPPFVDLVAGVGLTAMSGSAEPSSSSSGVSFFGFGAGSAQA